MPGSHLDLRALRNAIASLEGAIEIVGNRAWFDAQTAAMRNTLMASVIQNFEFVYELGIKMIRRRIELEADSPNEVDQTNFRDMLRIAGEKGLIADVEAWFHHRQMQHLSAHTYDQAKARQIYDDTLSFGERRACLAGGPGSAQWVTSRRSTYGRIFGRSFGTSCTSMSRIVRSGYLVHALGGRPSATPTSIWR